MGDRHSAVLTGVDAAGQLESPTHGCWWWVRAERGLGSGE